MSVAAKPWTIDDLEAMEDNGVLYELLRGEMIEVPGAKLQHWFLVGQLFHFLNDFVRRHGLGIVGINGAFVIGRDPDSLLIPDVAFVASDRLPPHNADWNIYLEAPDVAFDVVSPSDPAQEVHAKILAYLDSGVRAVVAVWPKTQSISVHRPGGDTREFMMGDILELDDVLLGFRLPIADLFRRPGPNSNR
jgi:Uma2 family endonuclease